MPRHSQNPTNGIQFAPRVQIWTGDGKYLYRVPAARALELIKTNRAEIDPEFHGSIVRRIIYRKVASSFTKRVGDPRIRKGTVPRVPSDVFVEILGYGDQRYATYTFRPPLGQDDRERIFEERASLFTGEVERF